MDQQAQSITPESTTTVTNITSKDQDNIQNNIHQNVITHEKIHYYGDEFKIPEYPPRWILTVASRPTSSSNLVLIPASHKVAQIL